MCSETATEQNTKLVAPEVAIPIMEQPKSQSTTVITSDLEELGGTDESSQDDFDNVTNKLEKMKMKNKHIRAEKNRCLRKD